MKLVGIHEARMQRSAEIARFQMELQLDKRFLSPLDVMKPLQPPYQVIFKYAKKVAIGKDAYCIPTLEMALTCKFAPMISLMRADEKKHQDAADFIAMVKKNAGINLETLEELGDIVYNGGGTEIVEMVRKVRAGEKLKL